jgi:hypothetical protein
MTELEAIELLKLHSFSDEIENEAAEAGFLGMLRPFKGELVEKNFHEVMFILKVLRNKFSATLVEHEILSSFWAICYLPKLWVLNSDGMLRRNNLISEDQIMLLEKWVDCISYSVLMLLDGVTTESIAFETYNDYLKNNPKAY